MITTDYCIGVDFDNTLVCYEQVLRQEAQRRGWISPALAGSKRTIRDAIRAGASGEEHWQELQAYVYGPGIGQAVLMPGAWRLLSSFRRRHIPFFIVSHKSEFAARDRTRTSLRTAARDWMTANGFFAAAGLGLSVEAVFFESTRQDKVQRIGQLHCTHFIDDLEETFREPGFPAGVGRLLFHADQSPAPTPGLQVFRHMDEIHDYFFPERA